MALVALEVAPLVALTESLLPSAKKTDRFFGRGTGALMRNFCQFFPTIGAANTRRRSSGPGSHAQGRAERYPKNFPRAATSLVRLA